MKIPLLHRCVTVGCQAFVSGVLCARCRDACRKQQQEFAYAEAVRFALNNPDMPVDLALFAGEQGRQMIYGSGDPGSRPPAGLVSVTRKA